MQKKVAVILSGCGVYDGSEIHEAVITLLRLDQRGAKVQCFAPNIPQLHVVDHLSGEVTGETRNVLTESARIARGEIKDVRQLHAAEFDAKIPTRPLLFAKASSSIIGPHDDLRLPTSAARAASSNSSVIEVATNPGATKSYQCACATPPCRQSIAGLPAWP